MDFKKKIGATAGALLVTGALLSGAAFASSAVKEPPAKAEWVDQAIQQGKLTPGEGDTLKRIGELRRSYMEKFKADAKTLVDQAVKDGKITQEQGDRMLKKGARFHHGKGHKMPGQNMTEQQLKEHLAQAVKIGKLTQDQADTVLKRWQERHSNAQQ